MTAALASTPDLTITRNPFLFDVIEGLTAPAKHLSPKYFYDQAGSRYFDEICAQPEYYPYRTELELLESVAADLARDSREPLAVVEFGAGSLKKIEPLLRQVSSITHFVPLDICGAHLSQCAARLALKFPHLEISPVRADFTEAVTLPNIAGRRLGFFPGSTIGNFHPAEALQFLQNARVTLGLNGKLLLGVDTKKSSALLHNAYNDSQGVTAKFNLNILARINRELDGDFDLTRFEHYAFYNPEQGCVQMHLISQAEQRCSVAGHTVRFERGESIHTENSYKYTPAEFTRLAELAGWQVADTWLAQDNLFSVHLLRPAVC